MTRPIFADKPSLVSPMPKSTVNISTSPRDREHPYRSSSPSVAETKRREHSDSTRRDVDTEISSECSTHSDTKVNRAYVAASNVPKDKHEVVRQMTAANHEGIRRAKKTIAEAKARVTACKAATYVASQWAHESHANLRNSQSVLDHLRAAAKANEKAKDTQVSDLLQLAIETAVTRVETDTTKARQDRAAQDAADQKVNESQGAVYDAEVFLAALRELEQPIANLATLWPPTLVTHLVRPEDQ